MTHDPCPEERPQVPAGTVHPAGGALPIARHGARHLPIVILSGEVTARRRQDLRDLLGVDWDDRQIIFRRGQEEVLISPMILSHMLAHVALRPELNTIFHELFSSGGAEIFFRPAAAYDLVNRQVTFRDVQQAVAEGGDTAVGVRLQAESLSRSGGVLLNPDRGTTWTLHPEDRIVVLTTCG